MCVRWGSSPDDLLRGDDALFVLLFIIFSKRVPLIRGLLSSPNGRSHFSGCPAKTLRQNGLANSDDIRVTSIDDAGFEWCQGSFVCKDLHLHTPCLND